MTESVTEIIFYRCYFFTVAYQARALSASPGCATPAARAPYTRSRGSLPQERAYLLPQHAHRRIHHTRTHAHAHKHTRRRPNKGCKPHSSCWLPNINTFSPFPVSRTRDPSTYKHIYQLSTFTEEPHTRDRPICNRMRNENDTTESLRKGSLCFQVCVPRHPAAGTCGFPGTHLVARRTRDAP